MVAHALAMSETAEHYTPHYITSRARLVMGAIDLDPCSCELANMGVQAARYYSKEQDGLAQVWGGRVYVNPPGDARGQLPKAFWDKLARSISYSTVTEFIWLAFNISQLRTLQGCKDSLWLLRECAFCIPESRIQFTGGSPTKDNAILYWGPNRKHFYDYFSDVGLVINA